MMIKKKYADLKVVLVLLSVVFIQLKTLLINMTKLKEPLANCAK